LLGTRFGNIIENTTFDPLTQICNIALHLNIYIFLLFLGVVYSCCDGAQNKKGYLGYGVDVFLATNNCPKPNRKKNKRRPPPPPPNTLKKKANAGAGLVEDDDGGALSPRNDHLYSAGAQLHQTLNHNNNGGQDQPQSQNNNGDDGDDAWGPTLRRAYSPWLRGLAIENCRGFADEVKW
jgi:hypothetical protein